MAREVLQRIEAEVPESSMPEPRFVIAVRRQAHGLGDLQIHFVASISGALHLGEEVPLCVVDSQHAVTDHHPTTSLVELPEADDVASELGDVVYVGEGPVLIVLALEDDGPASADLHT
jgi:hypothetical protein